MLTVTNLSKDYADGGIITHALRDVSFTIRPGEFVSIMGPSGSGKSTLLHILSFMDRPTAGTYAFRGQPVPNLDDTRLARLRNKAVGFVFQSFNLLSRASVFENVQMPLLYCPEVKPTERTARVTRAVTAVGIVEKLHTEVSKLSGGQKQRVAIARALVNDPEIIFADEPTGNLDSVAGAQVMDILETLNAQGRTVILVTHETYTAQFARRLLRIRDGRIETDELIAKHLKHKAEFFK